MDDDRVTSYQIATVWFHFLCSFREVWSPALDWWRMQNKGSYKGLLWKCGIFTRCCSIGLNDSGCLLFYFDIKSQTDSDVLKPSTDVPTTGVRWAQAKKKSTAGNKSQAGQTSVAQFISPSNVMWKQQDLWYQGKVIPSLILFADHMIGFQKVCREVST